MAVDGFFRSSHDSDIKWPSVSVLLKCSRVCLKAYITEPAVIVEMQRKRDREGGSEGERERERERDR